MQHLFKLSFSHIELLQNLASAEPEWTWTKSAVKKVADWQHAPQITGTGKMGTTPAEIFIAQYSYESDIMHGGRGGRFESPYFGLSIKRKVDPLEKAKPMAQIEQEITAEKTFVVELVKKLGGQMAQKHDYNRWIETIEG